MNLILLSKQATDQIRKRQHLVALTLINGVSFPVKAVSWLQKPKSNPTASSLSESKRGLGLQDPTQHLRQTLCCHLLQADPAPAMESHRRGLGMESSGAPSPPTGNLYIRKCTQSHCGEALPGRLGFRGQHISLSPSPSVLLGHQTWSKGAQEGRAQEAPARSSLLSPDLGMDHMVAAAFMNEVFYNSTHKGRILI